MHTKQPRDDYIIRFSGIISPVRNHREGNFIVLIIMVLTVPLWNGIITRMGLGKLKRTGFGNLISRTLLLPDIRSFPGNNSVAIILFAKAPNLLNDRLEQTFSGTSLSEENPFPGKCSFSFERIRGY